MNLIVITDEKKGMSFNGRRQSRDKILCEYILRLTHQKIYMTEYSAKLFSKYGDNIAVTEDFSAVGNNDFILLENISPASLNKQFELIYLFNWNKLYPADIHFDLDLSGALLASSNEFEGSSHEKITCELYSI